MTEQAALSSGEDRPSHQRDSAGWLMKSILIYMRSEMDRRMEPLGLTEAQWVPVLHLASGEVDTAAELSRHCMQSAGGMTRMLDRLEAKGFVQRVRSSDDRRVVNLELTEEGQRVARVVPTILCELNQEALGDLAPAEVEQFKSYLKRILSTVEHRMPTASTAPASSAAISATTPSFKNQNSTST